MGSLLVIVRQILADHDAQMTLAEKDGLAEALATCGRALLNKSLAGSQ